MPNWCMNNVDITAKTPEAHELLARVAERDKDQGLFDTLRPMPAELRDTTAPSEDGNDWYNWSVNNWGTKWDVDPIHEESDGETLSLSFDSAWSPPIALYEYLTDNGFEVSANYYEPGMAFAGEWVNGDDFCIDDVYELARQDTDTLSTREYDILEMFGIWEEVAQYDEDEFDTVEVDDEA